MNQDIAKQLIQKYNQGLLSEEEDQLLEECIEKGFIKIEDLEDLHQLNQQLDVLFDHQLSQEMRKDFFQMVESEKNKKPANPLQSLVTFLQNNLFYNPVQSFAYSLALVIIGLGFGFWISSGNSSTSNIEIAQLSAELKDMRETMLFTLLEKESISDRLKAVSLTQDMEEVSENVATALLTTLNQDENINVRLAAIEALYPYANNPTVREGLIKSIAQQDSPLVQTALAEVMVALQEKRSVNALKELLQKEQTPQEIKAKIQESIEVLL